MLLLAIIFTPFFAACTAGFFGRWLGNRGAMVVTVYFAVLNALATLSFSLIAWMSPEKNTFSTKIGVWINSGLFKIDWGFSFDNVTLVMLVVVTTISSIVHIYSTEYMAHDPHSARFMSYLSLFTFFMLILVTADNLILLFLGWEFVGLCSYLLISFWYTRVQASKSAIKALVVNRVSDYGFTLGVLGVFFVFQSVEFPVIFALAPFFQDKTLLFCGIDINILNLLSVLLFIGAMGKSAQIGLHTWLPDAMEGPTPVSALIHAATMVTAGVFLIIKCSPLFEYAPNVLTIITLIGALTAFFAATSALLQSDIKKVIAYSTCSQLGYMFFICGLSGYHISLFHLANHAFFKALLFLSAGAIIHTMNNEQDLRKYGGLLKLLPLTYIMLLIGSLSLMGIPFLTGFYSKDLILEFAYAKYHFNGWFAYLLGLLTAFLTSFYSMRVLYLTFLGTSNSYRTTIRMIPSHDELPVRITTSLLFLSIGSIFLGYVAKDLFVGIGTDFWNSSILILPENNQFVETEFVPLYIKLSPLLFSLLMGLFYYTVRYYGALRPYEITDLAVTFMLVLPNLFIRQVAKIDRSILLISKFLINKWYFDTIYNTLINIKVYKISYTVVFKWLDKGIFELIGPYGLTNSLLAITKYGTRYFNQGYAPFYAGCMFYMLAILTIFFV